MNIKFLLSLAGVVLASVTAVYTQNPEASWQVYAVAIGAAVASYLLGLNQDPNTQPAFMRRLFRRVN